MRIRSSRAQSPTIHSSAGVAWLLTATAVFLLAGGAAQAQSEQEKRLLTATEVVRDIADDSEKTIPADLLDRARGIAVIPQVVKVGFIVGGQHGKGVMVVRKDDGSWSNPFFLSFSSGSVGLQFGAQAADVVLLFMTDKSTEAVREGKFTLGADATATAGPIGRQAGAKAEIYSYSFTKGLFAGLSAEGAVLNVDDDSNGTYYGKSRVSVNDIVRGRGVGTPSSARRFLDAVRYLSAR